MRRLTHPLLTAVALAASLTLWSPKPCPAQEPAATPTQTGEPTPPDGEDPGEPPYAPWQGESLPPPPTPPPVPAPAPRKSHPERARRPVELGADVGLLMPFCPEGLVARGGCTALVAIPQGGGGALWRVHPYFAFGGTVVGGAPLPTPAPDGALTGTLFVGVAARVYALETGAFDPYLALGLGRGALRRTFDDPAGGRAVEVAAGPALQLGGGLDYFLSQRLKLGPTLTLTSVVLEEVQRCGRAPDARCSALEARAQGQVASYATLGARLTIMVGDPL